MRSIPHLLSPVTAVAMVAFLGLSCTDGPAGIDNGAPTVEAPSSSVLGSVTNTYVLTAGTWGEAQTNAVIAAGGVVAFSHRASGIGVAKSDDPGFLEKALASDLFSTGAQDIMVDWQREPEAVEFEPAAITPSDEPFSFLQWNMQAIEAEGAWEAGYDGAGARVAVIDGGIYDVHVDLTDRIDRSCSVSVVPGHPYNYDVGTLWHATHVAGIVAASDNGEGVIGVAPAATIMAIKALHGGSGTFGQVIEGILFASDPAAFSGWESCERADIINMSFSGIFSKRSPGGGALNAVMAKAVNFAAQKGVLVLSAAGNYGVDLGQLWDAVVLPAQSGSGLAVSGTGPIGSYFGATNYRSFAPYSAYGEDLVTVAGPGGNDASYINGDDFYYYDWVLSPCRGSAAPPAYTYCWAYGTSMSTPAAAGVAALIVGKYPGISLGRLKAILMNTADDEGPRGVDEFYGRGFINARRAVGQ